MGNLLMRLKPRHSCEGRNPGHLKRFQYLYAFILLFLFLCLLTACSNNENKNKIPNRAMVVSVSSNGKYAFTTNSDRNAYLWNIKDKTYQKINHGFPVNIYSAYFIPNTNLFMYQNDKTNEVIIENVNGKVIKTFNPGIPTYGEIISKNLKYYATSEENWNAYLWNLDNNHKEQLIKAWCIGDHHGKKYRGSLPVECASVGGAGKLLSFNFTPDQNTLIASSGYLYIWDIKNNTSKVILKNSGQTSNAIAPNGNYVITADSNGHAVKYNFDTKKITTFSWGWDENNLPTAVKNWSSNNTPDSITSINFITNDKVIITSHGIPKPFLFIGYYNPAALKAETYMKSTYAVNNTTIFSPLVKNPNAQYPSDNGLYPQTQSFLPVVATSPSAHILVMAQANGGGIMVYQYHPEEQTLKLIWAPQLK